MRQDKYLYISTCVSSMNNLHICLFMSIDLLLPLSISHVSIIYHMLSIYNQSVIYLPLSLSLLSITYVSSIYLISIYPSVSLLRPLSVCIYFCIDTMPLSSIIYTYQSTISICHLTRIYYYHCNLFIILSLYNLYVSQSWVIQSFNPQSEFFGFNN